MLFKSSILQILARKLYASLRLLKEGGIGNLINTAGMRYFPKQWEFLSLNVDRFIVYSRYCFWRLSNWRRRIIFITFADGKVFTSTRLVSQVASLKLVNKIIAYDPLNIGDEFYSIFHEHVKYSRGFGYFCWKPFIVRNTLRTMKKGDILIYADAGCSVTTNARRELCADILRLVLSKEKLMALLVLHEGSYQPEKKWTKSDLLDYFGYLNNNRVYNSNSVAASFFAIVATAENAEFAENWFRISTNLHLIDDSPSLIETTRILLNIGMIKAFFLCCCKKNLLLRV